MGESFEIGTAHAIAQFEQHFGESAHADASDADEVNRLGLKKHFNNVLFRLLACDVNTAPIRAIPAPPPPAAPLRASRRFGPLRPLLRTAPDSRARRVTSSTKRSPVISASSTRRAAPAVFERLRIPQLMLIGRRGQRHQNRRLARRREFAHRAHARAADNQIRFGERLRHIGEKRGNLAGDSGRAKFRCEFLVRARPGLMNQAAREFFSHSGQLSSAARFSVREPWLPPVISTVNIAPRGFGGDREKFFAHRQPGHFGTACRKPRSPSPGNSPARAPRIAPACDA